MADLNQQMRAELLPCPFCGSKNVKAFTYDAFFGGEPDAFSQCQDCSVTGPNGKTEAEAITAWNRRQHGSAAQAVAASKRDIFAICDAYESGIGHGLQRDGHKSGAIFGNPECGKAYEIGYAEGDERADGKKPKVAAPPVADTEGVKPWQERIPVGAYAHEIEAAKDAEIAELRALSRLNGEKK